MKGLIKSYSRNAPPALREVTLDAGDGELLVVVGPSGSGKSTLLRCIAGLEIPDRGTVVVDGHDVTGLDPARREIAMVFQDHALYPHLDVATNIGFPLLARKTPKPEIAAAVETVAATLELSMLLDRYPGELSGGERRRVSLARAVIREPSVFLMDEPLSNLDAALKLRVQDEIRSLQERLGVTMVYVTHDQVEAMTLGHRIAVLRSGAVEQVGTPLDLYDSPANVFVASFLGRTPMNLFPADVFMAAGNAVTAGIRPEHLRIGDAQQGRLRGTIRAFDHLGSETLIEVEVAGERVFVRAEREDLLRVGDEVGLDLDDRHLHLFAEDDTRTEP